MSLWFYAWSAGLIGPLANPPSPPAEIEPEADDDDRSQPLARDGDAWVIRAWGELSYQVARRTKSDTEEIAHLIRYQQPSGAFLQATPADSIELLALHELQILHAVESFAVRFGDESARVASQRAAEWHVQETQPDHATSQPWGLNAMIRTPAARPLADMMLQAVRLASVDAMDAVTLLLLRDCLYCIERYEAEGIIGP